MKAYSRAIIRIKRKLRENLLQNEGEYFSAVIMVIDAVSYSKHMEVNPSATLNAIQSAEKFVEDATKNNGGKVFNKAGDSLLLIFEDPVAALKLAIEFQSHIVTTNSSDQHEICLEFRVGINVGEVTRSGKDYLGDGVNIAARLETLSQPNGICVSKSFYDQTSSHSDFEFESLGTQKIKENKFKAYDVITPWYQKRGKRKEIFAFASVVAVAVVLILASLFSGDLTKLIRDDDQIRLAILPFDISELPSNQKYLASSMQDDLIVDMARIDKFLVLATNSTEQFKNGIQEQEKIFKLLSPNYFLVTKARSSGDEIKIISQLIDENGSIAWAENYDSIITEIDTIQKKFEIDLVGGLGLDSDTTLATLDNSSVTINPIAYDLFKRGRASRDREISRNLYREAIAIEPNFAAAHSSLAINMSYGFVGKERNAMGSIEFDTFKMEALNHARYGVQIAPGDPLSHYGLAFVHYQATELDEALMSASKALDIDGNNPLSLMIMSAIKFGLGQYEEVLEVADRLRLVDPLNSSNGLTIEASAHFALTNYQTALALSAEANDRNPNYVRAHIIMIASNWALENTDDAAWQYEELTLTDAGANLEQFLRTLPWPKEFKTKLAKIFSDINASS